MTKLLTNPLLRYAYSRGRIVVWCAVGLRLHRLISLEAKAPALNADAFSSRLAKPDYPTFCYHYLWVAPIEPASCSTIFLTRRLCTLVVVTLRAAYALRPWARRGSPLAVSSLPLAQPLRVDPPGGTKWGSRPRCARASLPHPTARPSACSLAGIPP